VGLVIAATACKIIIYKNRVKWYWWKILF